MLDFRHFFLILLSWLKNHVQSQQQKIKVRFGSSLRDKVVGGSVGASSFGWFLGGFGWFLLVEGDFGWSQVVCCFNSYISFTAYRTLNSLLYSWSYVICWGHSKKIIAILSPSPLKISNYFLYSTVFYVR